MSFGFIAASATIALLPIGPDVFSKLSCNYGSASKSRLQSVVRKKLVNKKPTGVPYGNHRFPSSFTRLEPFGQFDPRVSRTGPSISSIVALSPFFLLGGNQTASEEFGQFAVLRCFHSNSVDANLYFSRNLSWGNLSY
jgi:hypothetical protein